jgi:putative CocE/NonD family hydrolase
LFHLRSCTGKSLLSAVLVSLVVSLACRQSAAQQPAKSSAVTASQLEQVSGEYTDPTDPDTPLSFYTKDRKLYFESDRQEPKELTAVSATEYTIPDANLDVKFTLAADGNSVKVTEGDFPSTDLRKSGPAVHHVFRSYTRKEAMVPVRDGVKLHVVILTPTDTSKPWPILMQRTPYGVDGLDEESFARGRPELARAGYIYVGADIRGRFKSEGEFQMMRPLSDHHDSKAVDESTDAYDTISWLLKNIPNNNGRVGVVGTSYPGFLTIMAGINPDATHPAVKAISPQAPMIDVWKGDDFFHNGAFRQTYGYDYAYSLETGKENADVDYGKDTSGKPVDGFDYFLKRGSFIQDVKQSGVKQTLPTWQGFLEHPTYDSYWAARGVARSLTTVSVPTLTVGGYYDQEDMYGPQQEYASLEPHDSEHQNFLVLGPWRHGSWASSSRHLGALQYGGPIGREFREQIEAKFFAKYLKDEPGFDLEDTASFQTGSNTWKRYAHFPPAEAKNTPFILCGNHEIATGTTICGESRTSSVSYVSDPANPVPYRHRPIQPTYGKGSQWYTWMVEDQRFVTSRKDLAVWRLPIDHDLTVTGEVMADIFASTSGSDGDFVAKVIDQYPEDDVDPAMRGFQLMTNMEIFRGRYQPGFDKPTALKPGEVTEFQWSLHDIDHVFKKGHTLLVEIQSTWFPLYDLNPQTFVPNIMLAKPEDYKPATITIVNDLNHPSQITLPVIP